MRALTAEQFSVGDAVGGVRGLIESVAPGLVFVVVFVASQSLRWSLISSVAVAVVAVILRLIQRTPITQAFGGLLGVAIGVIWAWRSGEAQNYYAWGLWTNAAYLAAMVASIVVRWPAVGLVVEAMRSGLAIGESDEQTPTDATAEDSPDSAVGSSGEPAKATTPTAGGFTRWAAAWRTDRLVMRRYTVATWLWVAMFALRLAVQVPLFLGGEVGWLGTARIVMGIPLWALVLWLTWAMVRHPHEHAREILRPTR